MSDLPAPEDPSRLRISHADRERVAQILHNAMAEGRIDVHELEERLDTVYSAKTFADLVPVTRDLPVPSPGPTTPAVPQPHAPALPGNLIGGTPGPSTSIAVMSGVDRRGVWTVPRQHSVVAVMGGVDIDLTEARFAEREVTISIFTLMGGVDIVVPEGLDVRVNGVGFMGAFEDGRKGDREPAPGSPIVRITGFAMMAGVDVKHPKRRKRDRRREIEE